MAKRIFAIIFIFLLTVSISWLIFRQHKPDNKTQKFSGALEALNLWSFQRAYPDQAIPNVGHFAAFEQSQRAMSKKLSKSAQVAPWRAIGPCNMGGRTLAVVFNPQNPNTIYAGSASGGLWRSYSGGVGAKAWDYVATGFPVLAVSSIAFAPNDSNTIYIGTGEVFNYQAAGTGAAYRATRGTYGVGILKTTDGGLSWSKSLDWSYQQQRGVWAIKINPLNPKTIWAATTEGTYKTTDAGKIWTRVHPVIMATDIIISPIDTNVIVVGCGNFGSTGHGLYRSADGGESWFKVKGGVPETFQGKVKLDVFDGTPSIMLTSIGNGFYIGYQNATWLCDSWDNGATWNLVTSQDYSLWQGWYSHDVAVNPKDFTHVMAVGIDIWKSKLGGANLEQKSYWTLWQGGQIPPGEPEGPPNYSHADHHDVVFHPTQPNIIYFGTDGGVFRSLDGGETFESCNGGYQSVQFYNGFACSQQDSALAIGGMQDNGTIIYRGTDAWDRIVLGGDGCCAAIDATNDNIMYGSSQNLNISRSDNRGQSWRRIAPPNAGGYVCFVAPYVLGIDKPEIVYAGQDVVFKSLNRGNIWTRTNNGVPLDGNPVFAMAISYQNSNILYAATAPALARPGIFRTLDGGQTWDNITGDLPDRFPGDLAVDPNDDAVVYLTFMGFGTAHVYKSENYGDRWQNIGAGLPDVPTAAIVVDPLFPNNIYAGNDLGVYVSTTAGENWEPFLDGLPDAVIAMDLAISPVNRKLRVATHGNGAYERDLISIPVSVSAPEQTPSGFVLEQNYPNPFNPSTTIRYTLPRSARVSLTIYNSLGQKVKTLLAQKLQNPGNYQAVWDGKSDAGISVASGTYVYRLQAGDQVASKPMHRVQ